MNKFKFLVVALLYLSNIIAQESQVNNTTTSDLKLEVSYGSDEAILSDLMAFEGIDYQQLHFTGEKLKGKSYKITVKEIWNGKIKNDSVVFDSKTIGIQQFETLDNEVLKIRIISKLTDDNKLRMTFKFPRFSLTKEFDAIESNLYSLRNLVDESGLQIDYQKPFYFLAYILPYEREDGSKSWCDVGGSGKDVENWGKRFGIEHYLLFEMILG